MKMNTYDSIAAAAEAIYQAWPEIRAVVTDEQAQAIVDVLKLVANASDEESAKELITDVLMLGFDTPAKEVFRRILRHNPLDDDIGDRSRLAYHFGVGDKQIFEIKGLDDVVTSGRLKKGIETIVTQLQASLAATEEISQSRYLNAGFFTATEEWVPPDQPLCLERGLYLLVVNIGEFWSPGVATKPFPTLPDEMYREDDAVALDVVARPQNEEILITSAPQTLYLPKTGNSHSLSFPLSIARPGSFTIDVDVLYRGHLLQSRRTTFKVIQKIGDVLPPSAWPVQDGYITFARAANLTAQTLAPLAGSPRRLTVLAERDINFNRIGLHFYHSDGETLSLQESRLTDTNLARLLTVLRSQLADTMHHYTGGIGGDEVTLTRHLGILADLGRTFYRQLLPGLAGSEKNEQADHLTQHLQPESIIQVAPLSAQLSIPWELLYERPIHQYQEGRTRLCSNFREHGPNAAECPHVHDPYAVCPHGFWGYRYIIEQLPCYIRRGVLLPSHNWPLLIHNLLPMQFITLANTNFRLFSDHWQRLRSLTSKHTITLKQFSTWPEVEQFLTGIAYADVVYFYTHGGKNVAGSPFLKIGDGSEITENDLDAWRVNWRPHSPLIVLNACESADYSPDSFENLIHFFCERGAAGVIGTQCEVKEILADAFIIRFFQKFLQQKAAGEALFAARRELLFEHLDPRGLVYSLFAAAEVKLAQPVIAQLLN